MSWDDILQLLVMSSALTFFLTGTFAFIKYICKKEK